MKWNYNRIACILMLSLLVISVIYVVPSSEADADDTNATIHIGTFLPDVDTVDVLVGSETHNVKLSSDVYDGFEGMKYGVLKVNISDRIDVEVGCTDLHNGASTKVSPGSNAYLWITNYIVSDEGLIGYHDGNKYCLEIDESTLSWSKSNDIENLCLGLNGKIKIGDGDYSFESVVLPNNVPITELAVVGMEVVVGGSIEITESELNYGSGPICSTTYKVLSGVTSIRSILLWDSSTGLDESRVYLSKQEYPPVLTNTIYTQQLGFGAFENLSNIWMMDTELNAGAFSHTSYPKDYTNRELSSWYLGGTVCFEDDFFSTHGTNSLTINILDDDIDYVGFMDHIHSKYPANGKYTLYFNLNILGDAIGDQGEKSNVLSVSTLTIGESVKTIGKNAFKDFKVTTMKAGTSVEYIGDDAFNNFTILNRTYVTALNGILDSVTSIGENAFKDSSLDEADLSSAKSIGSGAFSGLYSLKKIVIGNDLEANLDLTGIFKDAGRDVEDPEFITEESLYTEYLWVSGLVGKPSVYVVDYVSLKVFAVSTNQGNTAVIVGLESDLGETGHLTIPSSVRLDNEDYSVVAVYSGAFKGNSNLTNVSVNSSISVGAEAFSGCSSLKTLTLSEGAQLQEVRDHAFKDTGLTEVDLSGCIELGTGAFDGCKSLNSVTLSNIEKIPDYAFRDAPIREFHLAGSSDGPSGMNLESIGAYAFNGSTFTIGFIVVESIGMDGLGRVDVESLTLTDGFMEGNAKKINLDNVSVKNLILNGNGVNIQNGIFQGKTSLETVDGIIRQVGTNAFSGCTSLKSIEFSNMTTIGTNAFSGCTSLSGDINLSNVIFVGSKAFSGCTGLTEIIVNNGATVYHDSFDNWNIVTSDVEVRESEYGGEVWEYYVRGGQIIDADPDMEYILVPSNIHSIGEGAFSGCTSLHTVEFESGSKLVSLYRDAFSDCTALKSIAIPDSVESIGNSAFRGCTALESIHLPSGLTEISYQMLRGTASLKSVTIPNEVIEIGQYAFQKSGLESIDLSNTGVIDIGAGAFAGCTELKTVILPELLEVIGDPSAGNDGAFQGCTSLTTVAAAGTGIRNGVLVLPSTVEVIGSSSFQATSVNSVEISANVSDLTIHRSAFYGISNLESVILKNTGDIVLGAYAFGYNTVLQSIIFETGDGFGVDIDGSAFSHCPTIGTDSGGNRVPLILDSVRSIGSNAFGNCTSLSIVEIPAMTESIAYDAFAGCIMLDEFRLDTNNSTYRLVNGLLVDNDGTRIAVAPTGATSVTVPKGITEFGSSTTSGSNSNVFTLMKDLEEILVEDGNTKYVYIGGWLAEAPGDEGSFHKVVAIPLGKRMFSINTGLDLQIPGYVLVGSDAKTISLRCGSIILDQNSLMSDALRNVEIISSGTVMLRETMSAELNTLRIEADGNVTIDGSINAADVNVISDKGKVFVQSGRLNNAKTAHFESGLGYEEEDVSKTGLFFPDGYFGGSAGTMSDLELITIGNIVGGTTLIGEGYVVAGGSIALGYNIIEGNVASIPDVKYYIQEGKELQSINGSKFVIDTEYGVIRQIDVNGSEDIEYYVSSNIDGIGLNFQESEDRLVKFSFTSDDNYQTWDLRVQIFNGNEWEDLGPTEDGKWYTVSNSRNEKSVTKVILRVDSLEAGMDDDYVRVTFDTRSSVSVPYMMVVKDRSILVSQLPEPVRVGYSFDGWYLESTLSTKYEQQKVSGATTLYAKWSDLDPYVQFVGSGGYFTDVNGERISGGGLIVNGDSGAGIVKGQKYYFSPGSGYEFIGFDVASTMTVEWDEGTDESGRHYVIIYDVDGYATVTPAVKFYSLSSDLQGIIDVGTVAPEEDLIQSWAFANNPIMSGMSWHNTPGTPLIVNDHVYLHLGPAVYKLDIKTGKEVARADSVETGNFYNHIGYGGSGDSWYILDFATGNVLDEDLDNVINTNGANVVMPRGMTYAKWYDGYFYTVFKGEIWKMDPSSTNPEGVMNNLSEHPVSGTTPGDIFSQYGITSSVLIEKPVEGNPTMYWLSSDGDRRYVYAADLKTCEVSCVELSDMRGYFMDDGWLTYYDGYIYTTGYTQGLFGDRGADGNSKIVYFGVNGIEMRTPSAVEIPGSRNSLLSGFVIVEGRGYVNATRSVAEGGDLLVYNIVDHKPVYGSSVKSDSSHGGIVVSTANLSRGGSGLNGYVNIYMMNYSGSNYLYVFTDRVSTDNGKTIWTLDSAVETKELAVGYGSQAIRVDPEGRILYYNDSGALYCYVPAHLYSDYYFFIETNDGFEVVVGAGDDPEPYTAMEDAIRDVKRYKAVYDENDNTMRYANILRYAYYYDGEMFRPLNTCPNLESQRYVFLLKESDYNNIDQDRIVFTTEGEGSGRISPGLPITLDGTTVTDIEISVGETIGLSSENGVRWASSNSSVIRVDADGNITAVSLGNALITVTKQIDGKTVTSSCMVSATSARLGTIAENLSFYRDVGMTKNRMYTLSFDLDGGSGIGSPTAGSYEAGVKVTLPSEESVSKSGYELQGWLDGDKLYNPGSDYIVLDSVELKAYWMEEGEAEVTLITVTDSSGNIYNGTEITLSVTDDPLDLGASLLPASYSGIIQWSSDKPNVVKVENGKVTAMSPGTATITVSVAKGEATATFTVNVSGYGVVISESAASLTIGSSLELEAGYEGGKPLMGHIEWTSSNPAVAFVDSDGIVKAMSEGSAVITATAPNGNTAICVITVKSIKIESIDLNKASVTMDVGGTEALKATAKPADAQSMVLVWTSSNPQVASVTNTGVITAISAGTAIITVATADGSVTATCKITVQGDVTSIVLDRTVVSVEVSETVKLTATASPSGDAKLTWRSSDSGIAYVDSSGNVRGVAPGTAEITVSFGDISVKCTVTVYKGSEVVYKGTVTNGDGTKTNTTEETVDAGDTEVVTTTKTTTKDNGDIVGKEVTIVATTEGSSTTTEITITTDADGNTSTSAVTTIHARTSVSNGSQTVTVNPDDISAAVSQILSVESSTGQKFDRTIVIDAGSSRASLVSSSMTIDGRSLDLVSGIPDANISILTGVGSVWLSHEAVSSMAGSGDDVRISVTKVIDGGLTEAQKAKVRGNAVYSLETFSGSASIHELGGKVRITLPHDLKGGKAEDVRAYYINDAGDLTEHRTSYDRESGCAVFETDHFSYFVVSNGSLIDPVATSDGGISDSTLLIVVIALLAVLIVMFGINMYRSYLKEKN